MLYRTVFFAAIISGFYAPFAEGGSSMEETPTYLYKILSTELWEASQGESHVILASEDDLFIHFSKEDQLERILTKYWSDAAQCIVLTIDVAKLEGELVYEVNPGGSAKYYHLYDGAIPMSAVVGVRVVPHIRA